MRSPRVLIVDDEKNMRTTLADILADEGYEVSIAESGDKAVKMFEKRPFDFVLLDVRMPGMDGMEAFRRMRSRRSDAHVVLMSAYSMEHVRRQALDEGAVAFVRKPLNVEGLLKLLRGQRELTLLAVEAEPCISGEIADRLRSEGHRVLVAHSTDEAQELMRQIHADVVFLDEALCASPGDDPCARLRDAVPSCKTVLVSPRSPKVVAPAPGVSELRADAVLLKPLQIAEVLDFLARVRAGASTEKA